MSESLPFVVGAYASLPQRDLHRDYYALLGDQPWIAGAELPFPGDLAADTEWLAHSLPTHWDHCTVTAIPGTMVTLGSNPAFGLASPDEDGRAAALAFTEQIRDAVCRLHQARSQRSVRYVQLHSAPTGRADRDALARSLEDVAAWDWDGAQVVIEHCDAYIARRQPEKGFLSLADEVAVVSQLGLGIHINWGRSALEGRSAETVADHIAQCTTAGVLTGLFFSGAGPEATQYGGPWADGHLPSSLDEPTSLMTPEIIAANTHAAIDGGVRYLGAKACVPPEATLEGRLAILRNIYKATR